MSREGPGFEMQRDSVPCHSIPVYPIPFSKINTAYNSFNRLHDYLVSQGHCCKLLMWPSSLFEEEEAEIGDHIIYLLVINQTKCMDAPSLASLISLETLLSLPESLLTCSVVHGAVPAPPPSAHSMNTEHPVTPGLASLSLWLSFSLGPLFLFDHFSFLPLLRIKAWILRLSP